MEAPPPATDPSGLSGILRPADPLADGPRRGAWKYLRGVLPAVLSWLLLAGVLTYLLAGLTTQGRHADEANLREWLDESRVFRKTLGQLADEYLRDIADSGPLSPAARDKAEEIREQLRAMAEPSRQYAGRLPLFPVLYRVDLVVDPAPEDAPKVAWDSRLPMPGDEESGRGRVRRLTHPLAASEDGRSRAFLVVRYTVHTAGRVHEEEARGRALLLTLGGVALLAGVLAISWAVVAFRREQQREWQRFQDAAEVEHARLEAARARIRAHEAERGAELARLEMQSQIAAGIAIMAGSYAHNIKNLLVRPDDLLVRCIEGNRPPAEQAPMLQEVRQTIGTVTERLQQILHTVRRDPNEAKFTRLDLNDLLRDMKKTWSDVARDSWKMDLQVTIPPEPAWIDGDLSHLQQVIENLLMNARDATKMMRNQLRLTAGNDATLDPTQRRAALIKATGWKGAVSVGIRRLGTTVVLEVKDNGVGMTEEVRQKCLNPRFSTKQGAEYAGLGAGSGLGLAFVAAVLKHHKSELEIESRPGEGATFRVLFRGAPPPPGRA